MSEIASRHASGTRADPILEELVDEFARNLQSDTPVGLEEFACRHPERKDKLLRILPAMQVLAELGRTAVTNSPLPASPADGSVPITGTLGDFRILREVGRGGMGVVYEAEQISLGRRVALKVLPFASTLDSRQLQRFQNEVRAAASLQHPHIVAVHAVGCERGVHYYAMQFIDGYSLEAVVRKLRNETGERSEEPAARSGEQLKIDNRLSPEYRGEGSKPVAADTLRLGPQTLRSTLQGKRDRFRRVAEWGIQAARALEHAHSMGLVHRDVKPANLLVDAQGQLWVTDFGLARTAANPGLTMTGDVIGTLRYMSPEQALAKHGLVDHRTDVYALGATLYELLTLRPAVDGKDREEILRNLVLEEPKKLRSLNSSIPTDLETILLKAVAKEPADRYSTAQELADDLERFVKDEPIRARRPSLRRRLAQWRRRHRPLVIGVAVCLVTVLVLGSVALWSRERQIAATAAAVTRDLEEADGWQKQQQWAKGRHALERASGQLRDSGLQSLQDEVDKRYREVSLVAKLEQAEQQAASFMETGGGPKANQAYEAAFREHGLDVTRPAPEIARLIQASGIRLQLVMALEYWAITRDGLAGRNGDSLRAIARLADDDPWRLRLREARAAKDPEELVRLAEEDSALTQPPTSLLLLGNLIHGVPVPDNPPADRAAALKIKEKGLWLLRRAHLRYPSDFRINFGLIHHVWSQSKMQVTPELIGFTRAALASQPENADVYWLLGLFLRDLKNPSEAVAALRRCLELEPGMAAAHEALGGALEDQDRLAEAEVAYLKAIQLKRDSILPYRSLGELLSRQQRLPEAEKLLHDAIKHVERRNRSGVYRQLGNVLAEQQRLPEAAAAYHKAIELGPDNDEAYHDLGVLRLRQLRFEEAEEAFDKALKLLAGRLRATTDRHTGLATRYYNLGLVLTEQQKFAEAEAAFRKAIDFNPDLAEAHHNLGYTLAMHKKPTEAEPALRTAIKLKPNFAEAHHNLGLALRGQGKFTESLASLQQAHKLGHKNSERSLPSSEDVRRAQQLLALDAKLPSILNGQTQLADSAERLALGELCQLPCRQLYVAAVRFYSQALADPKLADDLRAASRSDAAVAAALASSGHGKDAGNLDANERARLREQARGWLDAELSAWRAQLQKEPDKVRPAVRKKMRFWQQDTDLAGVRGEAALAKLPETERQDWQKLWQDVSTVQRQAGEPMMRVKSTSPAAGGTIFLTEPSLQVNFTEPYDVKTVSVSNLTLSGGRVTSITTSADHTSVTYTLADLPQGALKVAIGALVDADGKPMVAYSESYSVKAELTSAGALDTTFNPSGPVSGLVIGPIAHGLYRAPILVQPLDGKIVVGVGDGQFGLARYNSNGSLDTTFGTDGIVSTAIGAAGSWVEGIAIDTSGNIVAAGRASNVIEIKKRNTSKHVSAFAVARYSPWGKLDPSFGNNGIVLTNVATIWDSAAGAYTVAMQGDDKIIVAGIGNSATSPTNQNQNSILICYNANGALDTTFGPNHNGVVIRAPSIGASSLATALGIQPDGKILVAGVNGTWWAPTGGFTVARFTTNGLLDQTFNAAESVPGTVTLTVGNFPHGIICQSNGSIVVAGNTYLGQGKNQLTLVRLKSSGQIDTSFGNQGVVAARNAMSAWGLAQNSQGDLLTCGAFGGNFTVAAHFFNGAPRTAFGINGVATADFSGTKDLSRGLAIQGDDKIVVAGFTCPVDSTKAHIALARFLPPNTKARSSPASANR